MLCNVYIHKISKLRLAVPLLSANENSHFVTASTERRERDWTMLSRSGKLKEIWTSDRYFLELFTADLSIK